MSASTPSSYVYATGPGEQDDAIDTSDEEYMRIPASRTTCEAVLLWPIFESRYPADYLLEPLLSASANCEDQDDEPAARKPRQRAGTAGSSRGIGANVGLEENVSRLVENFIAVVHTKNPILDILTLKKYARRVAEDGPGWDGPSCLVVSFFPMFLCFFLLFHQLCACVSSLKIAVEFASFTQIASKMIDLEFCLSLAS